MSKFRKVHYRSIFTLGLILVLLSTGFIIWAQEPPLPLPGMNSNGGPRTLTKTQTLVKAKYDFGSDISIDGDWLLTGSADPLNHGFAAYVYHRNSTSLWSQQTVLQTGEANYPYAVDLENNTAVVGVTGDGYDEWGRILVFTRDSQNNWSDPDFIWGGDLFQAVDLIFDLDPSGQRLGVIENYGEYNGTVFVFEPDTTGDWSIAQQLDTAPPASEDITVEGNTLYLSSYVRASDPYVAPTGVDIYDISGGNGNWTVTQTLSPSNGGSSYVFGDLFEFEGDRGVVYGRTISGHNMFQPYLYTFEKQNGVWSEVDILPLAQNNAVTRMQLDGNRLLVNVYTSPYPNTAFSTYVYEWNGSSWDLYEQFVGDSQQSFGLGDVDGNTLAVNRMAQYQEGQFPHPPKIDLYSISGGTTPTETAVPPTETPVTQPEEGLLVDGSFENGLAGWTSKLAAGDKIKCNKPTKIVAHDGLCALRFKGKTSQPSSVQQVITSGIISGDTLSLSGFVKAKGSDVKSKVKIVVRYADESIPKDKIVVKINSASGGAFVPFSTYQPNLSLNVASAPSKIKFIIKNSKANSKVTYDALKLEVE